MFLAVINVFNVDLHNGMVWPKNLNLNNRLVWTLIPSPLHGKWSICLHP
jgi:hypothetical protein